MAGLYIRSETDVTHRLLPERPPEGRAVGQLAHGYYRIGPKCEASTIGHLRLDLARPQPEHPVGKHHLRRQGPRAISTSSMAACWRWRWVTSSAAKSSTIRACRERTRQHRGPRVLGCVRLAQASTRCTASCMPDPQEPEVTAAIRYDDYSDVGGTWNRNRRQVDRHPSLVLRGTYATAFRAPGLYETSTANATAGFTTARDPDPLPGHRPRCGPPGDGARHQHRQPVHQAGRPTPGPSRRDPGNRCPACPAPSTTGTS